jgi:hypothetical protein
MSLTGMRERFSFTPGSTLSLHIPRLPFYSSLIYKTLFVSTKLLHTLEVTHSDQNEYSTIVRIAKLLSDNDNTSRVHYPACQRV